MLRSTWNVCVYVCARLASLPAAAHTLSHLMCANKCPLLPPAPLPYRRYATGQQAQCRSTNLLIRSTMRIRVASDVACCKVCCRLRPAVRLHGCCYRSQSVQLTPGFARRFAEHPAPVVLGCNVPGCLLCQLSVYLPYRFAACTNTFAIDIIIYLTCLLGYGSMGTAARSNLKLTGQRSCNRTRYAVGRR